MIVKTIDTLPTLTRSDGVVMTDIFDLKLTPSQTFTMGTAFFPPHTTVPEAAHTGDEISLVLEGEIFCDASGETHRLTSGNASWIPRGENHVSYTKENSAVVVWMLVE